MPKRFTDTEKWKKPFIRGLEGAYKLLWFYILDDCDHAGVWQVDLEVAKIRTGENFSFEAAAKAFGDRIEIFDSGTKWFISDFIFFQYGELTEKNRLHLSVINILKKHKIGPYKPLPRGQGKGYGKGNGEGKGKGQRGTPEEKTEPQVIMPFDAPAFIELWAKWKQYRKEIGKPYKAAMSEQAALAKLSKYNAGEAIEMIKEAIANGWQGIFEIKKSHNGNGGNARQGFDEQATRERLASYAERYKPKPTV